MRLEDIIVETIGVLHLTAEIDKRHGGLSGQGYGASAARQTPRCGSDGGLVTSTPAAGAGLAPYRLALSATACVLLGGACLVLGGCGLSSLTTGLGGGMFGGGSASKGENKPLTNEQMLTAAKADGPTPVGGSGATGCPRFQPWPRDHHVTIYEPGRAGDGLAVVHRGEITQTARECQIDGNRVTVKYGFSGRVLLGPRGKNGTVTLPVNIFVADAKRERIVEDRVTVEVVVGVDKPIGYFSSVKTVTFPIAEGARAGEYDVWVGFDQKAPGAG